MVVLYAYNDVFRTLLIYIYIYFFFFRITNMHKHAYTPTYVCYSNDFDLRNIQVAQDLPEWNDCISR
jgi:hypothetical protein